MADETRLSRGPKAADYFQNGAFPDKTPTQGHFVTVMPQSGSPFANWPCHIPNSYMTNKDMKLRVAWFSLSVTVNSIRLKAEFERHEQAVHQMNGANFDTAISVTSTVPGLLSSLRIAEIIMPRADMGDLNPDEWGRLRLTRDTGHAGDTMVGDALLLGWSFAQDND